jgi:hypothetical protein
MSESGFHGLATQVIENDFLRLEYLTTSGPRIVRLSFPNNKDNLLSETPDISWKTLHGDYYNLRGGHRLWLAPESLQIQTTPDNDPIEIEHCENRLMLQEALDPETLLKKLLKLTLHNDRAAVTLEHTIINMGSNIGAFAPWAITQLPLGGLAAMPQSTSSSDESGRLPNRQITLWPYSRISDERLTIKDDFIFLAGEGKSYPCKIGCHNSAGWLVYANSDTIFAKHSSFFEDASYPDWGCNSELFVQDRFIELETLGPLVQLESGESTTHTETWEIFQIPDLEITPENLRAWYNSTLT